MTDNITLPRQTVQQALGAIDLYQRNEHCEDELLIAGHFLRTALEQQQAEPGAWPMEGQPDGTVIPVDPSEMALPQQQAEPVSELQKRYLESEKAFQQQAEPVHGDIRALKYRIHELEGEVLGYKRMLDVAEAALQPQQQAEPVQKPKYMAQSNGRHSPLLTHMMNKRTALAEPEQSFEDEQRTINADEHRRANALEEAIHAAWSAGYVEGEKAVLEQQTEPVGWLDGNDKLADFMHRDLKAEHDKRGSATPREFTVPVYTAPPQRKPLTVKEINALPEAKGYWPIGMNDRILRLIRAAEAVHGIKEGT